MQIYYVVIETLKEINDNKYDYSSDNIVQIKYFSKIENLIFLGFYGDILKPIYILTKQFQK